MNTQGFRSKFGRALFGVVLLVASHSSAQEITADLVKVSTPIYRPLAGQFTPALGKYTYSVGWQGIPAAECTVNVEREGLFYHVTVDARTLSGVDLLYKLRYHAESVISAVDYQPKQVAITHVENSRKKIIEVSYLDSGEVKAYRIDPKGNENRMQFNPDNFMLEPFSAAFLARSLPWEIGQSREFDTFNGKSRYLLKLKAVDKVTMKVNGQPRETWVIEPEVHNLTNPSKDKKLKSAQIFVTNDEHREVLQIKSAVFIGSVFARLTAFEPAAGVQASPSFLAKNGDDPTVSIN